MLVCKHGIVYLFIILGMPLPGWRCHWLQRLLTLGGVTVRAGVTALETWYKSGVARLAAYRSGPQIPLVAPTDQTCPHRGAQPVKQTRGVNPVLVYCWAGVVDAGPTLNQHWVIASCFLGVFPPVVEIDWYTMQPDLARYNAGDIDGESYYSDIHHVHGECHESEIYHSCDIHSKMKIKLWCDIDGKVTNDVRHPQKKSK